MLIVQNRKIRKERQGRKTRAKARRKAMRAMRWALLAVIAGLLGFFIYNNVDYFLAVADRFVGEERSARKAAKRSSEPAAADSGVDAPRKSGDVDDILGAPVFSAMDLSLLTHMSAVLRQMDSVRAPVRIVQPFWGGESAVDGGDDEEDEDELTVEAAAVAVAAVFDDVEIDANAGIDVHGGAGGAVDVGAAVDAVETVIIDTVQVAVIDVAVDAVVVDNVDTVAADPPEQVAVGAFLLPDISCRLADRDDLRINLTVELFYDSAALRDEVSFKRGALTAVVGNVVRGYEYGDVAIPALRGDLLNSFNGILRAGALTSVGIQKFSVESER